MPSRAARTWISASSTLTADELREIDAAAARIEVPGARYFDAAQRMIDR
jgi:hypothetical protein